MGNRFELKKGFTLVEILIVAAILVLISFYTVPATLNFFKSQDLDGTVQEVLQTLRRAQAKAMAQEGDSLFGVYFFPHQFVLFKGSSYAARDASYDEIFNISDSINISGLNEVVFKKSSGLPQNIGSITLNNNIDLKEIQIKSSGLIE